jgi:hypothetical protein
MLQVLKPPAQERVDVRNDPAKAVAPAADRANPHPILQLVQALLAHPPLTGLEPVAQELEPLARLRAVTDVCLGRIEPRSGSMLQQAVSALQGQAVGVHPGSHPGQRLVRLCRCLAQDHEVIRIPHHAVACFLHQEVERMQIEVRQQ